MNPDFRFASRFTTVPFTPKTAMSMKLLLKVLSVIPNFQLAPIGSKRYSVTTLCLGTVLLWLSWMSPGLAKEIRIAIQQNVPSLTVGSSTPAQVFDGLGRELGKLKEFDSFQAEAVPGAVGIEDLKAWQLKIVPEGENGLVYIGDR